MLAAAARDLAKDDVVFLGIDSRDSSASRRGRSCARFDDALPQHLRPVGPHPAGVPRHPAPNAVPSTVVIDPQGTGRGQRARRGHPDHARRPRRHRAGQRVIPLDIGGWFFEHRALRLARAGAARGGGRRARVVLLPVRGPAAARLPLLRDRPLGRRPRGRPARPDGAGQLPVRARLLLRLRRARHRAPVRSATGCSSTPGRSASCSASSRSWSASPSSGVVPWLQRDVRIHRVPAVGLAAAPLLGVLFGLGWTPCIGPTLSAVQALALHEGTAARGALLSVAYSLGLGIPFILAGLAFRRMLGAVRWVRRHQVWVTRLGGMMLSSSGCCSSPASGTCGSADLRSLGRRLRGGRVSPDDPRRRGRRRRDHAADTPVGTPGAEPGRAVALGVAAAHLDAHGAGAAVPARRSRRSPGPSYPSGTSTPSRSPSGRTCTRAWHRSTSASGCSTSTTRRGSPRSTCC